MLHEQVTSKISYFFTVIFNSIALSWSFILYYNRYFWISVT